MSHQANLLKLLEPTVRPAGAPSPVKATPKSVDQQSFAELLDRVGGAPAGSLSQPLKFSAHAQQRLREQGVELSEQQMQSLADAADRAEAKGGRDTLMMMKSNQMGLIVNIPRRTVVTALGGDRMSSGVVTQIDSAVMVDEPAAAESATNAYRINL